MLYGHGDDAFEYPCEIVGNFSSNILQYPMQEIYDVVCANAHKISSYPEPTAQSLKQKLANRFGISTRNVIVSNGATEIIYLAAQAFREKQSTIVIPTFSEYEDACRINHHRLTFVDNISNIPRDADVCWICNPNNPTGRDWMVDGLWDKIESQPKTLFIVDQSYKAFSVLASSLTNKLHLLPNVLSIQSLTKEYAIPGLRLGYALGNEKWISKMERFQMPWSVNLLALAVGKHILDTPPDIQPQIKEILNETSWLQKELMKIPVFKLIHPTHTHYFLCELKHPHAQEIKDYLANKHGLLIRNASNFRGLNEYFIRIATQSRTNNLRLINALRQWK